jgi:predicted nucleic acid-binding protein
MLVVCDTSPLSNLAIIGRVELLRDQFYVLRAEIARLRREAGFFVDAALEAQVLALAGE